MSPEHLILEEPDPTEMARAAGLVYVSDEEPGFRRKRWGRGFTYLDHDGQHVRDPDLRERFKQLVIPPAWTDVWISANPCGHLLVTGRDDKDRKQYIYHPQWEAFRNEIKFDRLYYFGEALTHLRKQIDHDLDHGIPHRRTVLALCIALLDRTLMRIGNIAYTRENRTFGLTTLRSRHVTLHEDTVELVYTAKGGKKRNLEVEDRELGRLLEDVMALPGRRVFKYRDEDGAYRTVSAFQINTHLSEMTGHPFTAKDFRTWGASVAAAEALAQVSPPESESEQTEAEAVVCASVAEVLGNTPTVSRDYYIHPALFEHYRSGRLADCLKRAKRRRTDDPHGLNLYETTLLLAIDPT